MLLGKQDIARIQASNRLQHKCQCNYLYIKIDIYLSGLGVINKAVHIPVDIQTVWNVTFKVTE